MRALDAMMTNKPQKVGPLTTIRASDDHMITTSRSDLHDGIQRLEDEIKELRGRLHDAELIVRDNLREMKNRRGGVVGYYLDLEEDDTARLHHILTDESRTSE